MVGSSGSAGEYTQARLHRGGVSAGHALALSVSLVGLALLVASCGGRAAPSVATLATTSDTATVSGDASTTATPPKGAALVECFASHGFEASIGSAGSGGSELHIGGLTFAGTIDPQSSQFQSAMQACRKYLPGGGPPSMTPAQQAAHARALARFAACMRAGGVPSFPDPNGEGELPFESLKGLDPNAPLFQTAYKACEPLLPTFGPQIRF